MLYKNFLVSVVAVAVCGLTLFGVSRMVHAKGNNNPHSGLIQFIAKKFNLSSSSLQAAVDQYETQHQQNIQQKMQLKYTQNLDNAVSKGKITSAQQQAILAEKEKLQSEYGLNLLKGAASAQEKQAWKNERAEIKAWSKQTGIKASYIMFGFGRGMHKSGLKPSVSPTPSS